MAKKMAIPKKLDVRIYKKWREVTPPRQNKN